MDKLQKIKVSSNIPEKILNETTQSSDIVSTPELVSQLIDEKYNDSLAYNICDVYPLKSNHGIIYSSRKKNNINQFEVVKKDIHTKSYSVNTGFTREVWDDMNRVYKKDAKKIVGNILSGLSANEENFTLINFLNNESEIKEKLIIPDKDNNLDLLNRLQKRVSQSVLEMNYKMHTSLDAFCVLSHRWASAILGSPDMYTQKDYKKGLLFLGQIGRTDFYVNPFPETSNEFTQDYNFDFEIGPLSTPDYAYVGVKSKVIGYSSLIFAPYMYELQEVIDPDTGESKIFMYNRYGLVASPLHKPLEGKSMLHKFEISL